MACICMAPEREGHFTGMEGKTKAPLSGIARKRLFFALVACVFTGIFVLTCITPMLSDDFTYSMLRSPLEAFQKEYEQYMTWGGRSVVHLILRLTMLMPKPVFNVLNALAAFCVGVKLGILPEKAAAALKSYRPEGMRRRMIPSRRRAIRSAEGVRQTRLRSPETPTSLGWATPCSKTAAPESSRR